MKRKPIRLTWARVDQWLDDDFFKPLCVGNRLYATPGGVIYHRIASEDHGAVFFPAHLIEHKGRSFLSVKDDEGEKKEILVDILIFEAFFCSIPQGWRVSHADGDVGNNNVTNLRLVSRFNNENWEAETPKVFRLLREKVGFMRAKRVMGLGWLDLVKIHV